MPQCDAPYPRHFFSVRRAPLIAGRVGLVYRPGFINSRGGSYPQPRPFMVWRPGRVSPLFPFHLVGTLKFPGRGTWWRSEPRRADEPRRL